MPQQDRHRQRGFWHGLLRGFWEATDLEWLLAWRFGQVGAAIGAGAFGWLGFELFGLGGMVAGTLAGMFIGWIAFWLLYLFASAFE